MNSYQQKQNAERLAAQHPDVQAAAKDIRQTLKDVEQYMYWALDPENKDRGRYDCQNLLDQAHQLVDQAHAFRAELKANPAPKEEDDEPLDEEPAHGRYEDSESYRSAMLDSGRGGLLR